VEHRQRLADVRAGAGPEVTDEHDEVRDVREQ
jgi:hypothetical protein